MKTNIYSFLLLFLVFLLVSCSFFKTNESKAPTQGITEPSYDFETEWTLKTDFWFQLSGLQINNILYTVEGSFAHGGLSGASVEPKTRIGKIDLNTGKYVWTSNYIPDIENSEPFKVGDKVGFFGKTGFLYLFNDSDGSLIATIRFSEDNYIAKCYGNHASRIVSDGNILYWSYIHKTAESSYTEKEIGIKKFDVSKINYFQEPSVPQLYVADDLKSDINYYTNPILENDILYFVTFNTGYEEQSGVSLICALDVVSGDFIWKQEVKEITGSIGEALKLVDENLFVFDFAQLCLNKNTGEIIFNNVFGNNPNKISVAPCFAIAEITYNNGYFYYTTADHADTADYLGISQEYIKNIVVVDEKTGKYVWGDFEPDSVSLMTNPIVHNGKMYVMASRGLRVYDINARKLLGVKKDFDLIRGTQKMYYWDNKFIFFDYLSEDRANKVSTLTAYNIM